jgi:hypothetical protein
MAASSTMPVSRTLYQAYRSFERVRVRHLLVISSFRMISPGWASAERSHDDDSNMAGRHIGEFNASLSNVLGVARRSNDRS